MHGVAHLVDEGEHAVEVILVVEQHVGVGPAVAGAVAVSYTHLYEKNRIFAKKDLQNENTAI